MQEKCPANYVSIFGKLLIYNDKSFILCKFFQHGFGNICPPVCANFDLRDFQNIVFMSAVIELKPKNPILQKSFHKIKSHHHRIMKCNPSADGC